MFEHPLWRSGSAVVCRRDRALGVAVAYVLLGEVAINPTIELAKLTQGWLIDSWGHNRSVCTRTQGGRSSDPTGDCPDLPGGVREAPAKTWVGGGLLQARGHGLYSKTCNTYCCLMNLFLVGVFHDLRTGSRPSFLATSPPPSLPERVTRGRYARAQNWQSLNTPHGPLTGRVPRLSGPSWT